MDEWDIFSVQEVEAKAFVGTLYLTDLVVSHRQQPSIDSRESERKTLRCKLSTERIWRSGEEGKMGLDAEPGRRLVQIGEERRRACDTFALTLNGHIAPFLSAVDLDRLCSPHGW